MKTYAYLRVSTDKQDAANQRFEIDRFTAAQGLTVDEYIEETVSGTKGYETRKLGPLLDRLEPGDLVICTEVSRLARSLTQIFSILQVMTDRGIHLTTIKDNFVLDDTISSKVLAFAFGLSAEIERNLISQRTKEALDRKRAEGQKLGRAYGCRNKEVKLTHKEPAIRILLAEGCSYSAIARLLHCDRTTLMRYIKNRCPDIEAERISHGHRPPVLSPEARAAVKSVQSDPSQAA